MHKGTSERTGRVRLFANVPESRIKSAEWLKRTEWEEIRLEEVEVELRVATVQAYARGW